jgi:hypothetical protein
MRASSARATPLVHIYIQAKIIRQNINMPLEKVFSSLSRAP